MATAMSQLNVRIPTELKAQGDAMLERAGISSTEAIRMLWQFAADHIHEPQAIKNLFTSADEQETTAEIDNPFEKWEGYAEAFFAENGLSARTNSSAPSFEELKESAYAEKYGW